MSLNIIREQIIKIAKTVLLNRGIPQEPDLTTSLAEDGLGLDSLGRLKLLAEIEKEMKVDLPEEYWGGSNFKNLGEIINLVSQIKA